MEHIMLTPDEATDYAIKSRDLPKEPLDQRKSRKCKTQKIKIAKSPTFMPDKRKPRPNKPFLIKATLGYHYDNCRTTFNESRGNTPWAKSSNDRIARQDTWMSVIDSKWRGNGRYNPVEDKYSVHPYRTYIIKEQGPEWKLQKRDPYTAPFSIPFDAAWISQDIRSAVNMPPLLQTQTFPDLDGHHKEKWRNASSLLLTQTKRIAPSALSSTPGLQQSTAKQNIMHCTEQNTQSKKEIER
jgi:hypothetical protein